MILEERRLFYTQVDNANTMLTDLRFCIAYALSGDSVQVLSGSYSRTSNIVSNAS